MIRVLVADDHLAVREGVRTLLANEGEITIVGQAGDGSTALVRLTAPFNNDTAIFHKVSQ